MLQAIRNHPHTRDLAVVVLNAAQDDDLKTCYLWKLKITGKLGLKPHASSTALYFIFLSATLRDKIKT